MMMDSLGEESQEAEVVVVQKRVRMCFVYVLAVHERHNRSYSGS